MLCWSCWPKLCLLTTRPNKCGYPLVFAGQGVYMVSWQVAYAHLANYYQQFLKERSTDFLALDQEYLHIEQVLSWLNGRINDQDSQSLLDLMEHLSLYFEGHSLHNVVLKNGEACLKAAHRLGQNPAWIYFNAYRANWGLGRWNEAQQNLLKAVQESSRLSPGEYANSLKSWGSLQLNKGNYREALAIFAQAKKIYRDLADESGENSISFEEAAYYLNINDYQKAYALYSHILNFELAREAQASDQTLLMMGVISRRLKKFPDSIHYLTQLFSRAERSNTKSAQATAAHHLAWVYSDLGQLAQARELGELALQEYVAIQDLRGTSDAYEQLGSLAMRTQQYENARFFLERSASMRKQLGNQHGYASSLRRLADLSFLRHRYGLGINYIIQSLFIYRRMGILTFKRLYKFISDWSDLKREKVKGAI